MEPARHGMNVRMNKLTRAEKKAQAIAAAEKWKAERMKVQTIVATGVCPLCAGKLRRNLSLTGWWQCEQLGAATHRKDANKPSCSWQGFTQ